MRGWRKCIPKYCHPCFRTQLFTRKLSFVSAEAFKPIYQRQLSITDSSSLVGLNDARKRIPNLVRRSFCVHLAPGIADAIGCCSLIQLRNQSTSFVFEFPGRCLPNPSEIWMIGKKHRISLSIHPIDIRTTRRVPNGKSSPKWPGIWTILLYHYLTSDVCDNYSFIYYIWCGLRRRMCLKGPVVLNNAKILIRYFLTNIVYYVIKPH